VPRRGVAGTCAVTVAAARWRQGGGVAKREAGRKAQYRSVLGVRVCVPAVSWPSGVAAQCC
jgi:hypothetical protein